MSIEIGLDWIDVYNEVREGNISWDEFQDYLMNLEKECYNDGFRDGLYSDQFDTGIVGEPQ